MGDYTQEELLEQIKNLLVLHNDLVTNDSEKIFLLSFKGDSLTNEINLEEEIEKIEQEYKPKFKEIDFNLSIVFYQCDYENDLLRICFEDLKNNDWIPEINLSSEFKYLSKIEMLVLIKNVLEDRLENPYGDD